MTGSDEVRITRVTRSRLHIEVAGRTMSLSGEAMPADGPVDFYADLASIRQWDDGEDVTDDDRATIIEKLPKVARKDGYSLVID